MYYDGCTWLAVLWDESSVSYNDVLISGVTSSVHGRIRGGYVGPSLFFKGLRELLSPSPAAYRVPTCLVVETVKFSVTLKLLQYYIYGHFIYTFYTTN